MEGESSKFPSTNLQHSANLPPLWKGCRKEKASASADGAKKGVRNWERREKMAELYDEQHSMVPNLSTKASMTNIVEETISYIKPRVVLALGEGNLKKPAEVCNAPLVQPDSRGSSSVSVSVDFSANMAFFGIVLASPTGMVTKVVEVFEKHKADVLAATVASDDGIVSMTVTSSLPKQADAARIKAELMTIVQ